MTATPETTTAETIGVHLPLEKSGAAALADRLSIGQLRMIVTAYAQAHPEHRMVIAEDLGATALDRVPLPAMRFEHDDETGPHFVNPRTGEPDDLQAVDQATRYTTMEPLDTDDAATRRVRFVYDGHADYNDICYVAESDGLPVSLPDGWREA